MFKLVSALRENHRRQPRPNGQVLPVCQGPHVSHRPRRRVRLPPHARAPRLASQRSRPHGRRGLLMYRGPRSPSPPLSPCGPAAPLCIYRELGPGRRASRTGCRARPLPNARRAIFRPTMAKSATRPIRQAGLPAVPRPSGLPSPAQKSPHPKVNLRRGLKKRAQVLICITSLQPGDGRCWP